MTLDPCYRDRNNGVYYTRNAHHPDCADVECAGCRACPGEHCTAKKSCSWHITPGELTCGRCVNEVRRDLRWIGSLAALMMTQAMSDGVESEAANLAANVADPEAWNHMHASVLAGRIPADRLDLPDCRRGL